jgi:hypothetical protein
MAVYISGFETGAWVSGSNSYAFGGGGAVERIDYAGTTWDPANKAPQISLSNINLTALLSTTAFGSVRATTGRGVGYYFEIKYSVTTGGSLGVGNVSANTASWMGADSNSVSYNTSGQCYFSGAVIGTGTTWGAGDVMGLYYNGASQIKIYKTGTLVITINSVPSGTTLYPAVTISTLNDSVTANFGVTAFSALPSGATAWDLSSATAPIFMFPRSRHYVRR